MWQYDFHLFYMGARAILEGTSPYQMWDFNGPYPLAVFFIPFALLPEPLAYSAFLTTNIALAWKLLGLRKRYLGFDLISGNFLSVCRTSRFPVSHVGPCRFSMDAGSGNHQTSIGVYLSALVPERFQTQRLPESCHPRSYLIGQQFYLATRMGSGMAGWISRHTELF